MQFMLIPIGFGFSLHLKQLVSCLAASIALYQDAFHPLALKSNGTHLVGGNHGNIKSPPLHYRFSNLCRPLFMHRILI